MPNCLPDDKLVPFSDMLGGLSIAPQFVHWADEDLASTLSDLYTGEHDHYTNSDWVEVHRSVRDAYLEGHLKERLYIARETIKEIARIEGAVCALCYSWTETHPSALIDEDLRFENVLHLSYDGEPNHYAPDPLCPKCRWHIRQYRPGERDLQLASLFSTANFQKRVRESGNHAHRHKFKIKRIK